MQAAGLTWIGPPAEAVRAMGSKIEAKKMMAAAGVPVLDELDPETVTADQLPVLVKASAGGGGRGMRVVTALADLPRQVEAARREAKSAFGDPTVFCERYLPTGHHVEVQVMADAHGTVWAVGERECSIQRRHQKIIEEAPSPLVERIPGMRAKLFDAARLAAEAIGYTGAGTVEFLADDAGDFFFLEMNTRLQVEHPVTEATTGLDLVELQLQVADGVALGAEPPAARGHSIEARLYAEDPAKNWQPQAGTRASLRRSGRPLRLRELGPYRRSGSTPASSTARWCRSTTTRCWPRSSRTRRPAGTPRCSSPTRWDAHGCTASAPTATCSSTCCDIRRSWTVRPTPRSSIRTAWPQLAAPLTDERRCGCRRSRPPWPMAERNRCAATVLAGLPSGWRNLASGNQAKSYLGPDNTEHHVEYRFTRDGVVLPDDDGVRLVSRDAGAGRARRRARAPKRRTTSAGTATRSSSTPRRAASGSRCMPRFAEPGSAVAKGSLLAPMPGPVIRVGAHWATRCRRASRWSGWRP